MIWNPQKVKLIVGLGNYEDKYLQTRHNAGFLWLDSLDGEEGWDKFSDRAQVKVLRPQLNESDGAETESRKVILAKPLTMMNNSGLAVRELMDFYKLWPQNILIAYDDMDIEFGKFKLQYNKGPHVHNGLNSVEKHLGTDNFWHLRIGIEGRAVKGNKGIPGMDYALSKFQPHEVLELNKLFQEINSQYFTNLINN